MPYKDYEKQKGTSREYYYKNRTKRLKQSRDYYLNHWEEKQKYRAEWRKSHPEKVKQYVKRYAQSPKGKIAARKTRLKLWKRDAPKRLARYAVRAAIGKGLITKPKRCEVCVEKTLLHAHHKNGYQKRFYLDIEWLCPQCHNNRHYAR